MPWDGARLFGRGGWRGRELQAEDFRGAVFRADLRQLGKRTWWGCGAHVPAVMDDVPKDQWCACEPKVDKDGTAYPPMGKNAD
ncbi:hypothetical protein ANO11243_003990 [Dothideomycetidae sp. 11243]|nr:hypothetical protein ANO11243_003990 [fungal sp. No.11243]